MVSMSLRRRMPAAAFAALIALSLAGCTPSNPTPTPSPTATHSPLFASDEEALKAATDAYAAYLKMSDTISHEGGANPERIKEYASGRALDLALRSAKQFRDAHARSLGGTQYRDIHLQSQRDGGRLVAIYACEDVSDVDVVDETGKSIVKPSRPTLSAFLLTLAATGQENRLKVEERETWPPEGICSS